jgi:hypothetical protein
MQANGLDRNSSLKNFLGVTEIAKESGWYADRGPRRETAEKTFTIANELTDESGCSLSWKKGCVERDLHASTVIRND